MSHQSWDLWCGVWRRLVGPLDRKHSALVLASAAAAAIKVGVTTWPAGRVRAAVMGVVAFDLVGGMVAFQLPATRAAYAPSSVISRVGFAAAHVQAGVVALTGQGSWSTVAGRYLAALSSTVLLESMLPTSPRRRAVATVAAVLCSVADLMVSRGEGQRWLGPAILVKVTSAVTAASREDEVGLVVFDARESSRFWSHVLRGPHAVSCWMWTGAIGDDGYGRFWIHDDTAPKQQRAVRPHRWALAHALGGWERIEGPQARHWYCVRCAVVRARDRHDVREFLIQAAEARRS